MSKSSDPVTRIRSNALEAAAPALAEHAEAIRSLSKRVVSDVLEIGERLAKAKQLIGHGHWLNWLKSEFQWSDETARRFMDVYELSKFHTVRDLGQQIPLSALYALARKSTSEETRDAVLARYEAGETVSLADVQATIAERKAAARAVHVPVTITSDARMAPVYVNAGSIAGPAPERAGNKPVVRLDGEYAAAQHLILAIEAYGRDLTDAKQSKLQKAATVDGRDRSAIRRCIDSIIAAFGDGRPITFADAQRYLEEWKPK